jgi:hypothetical protein
LQKRTTPKDLAPAVDAASDYLYLAADLKNVPQDAAPALLVVASRNTIMRINLAVAFADNSSRMVTVEEISNILTACNAARAKLGLGAQPTPPILQSALDERP